jgi:hypothetical protein
VAAIGFVRVVHRQGWDVEIVSRENQAEPETRNFADRDAALEFARSLEPDWIEVGEVVYATETVPQHHEWETLRRRADGNYAASALKWGGGNRNAK